MVWPHRSDLIIMELVCNYMKRQTKSAEKLSQVLQDAWNNQPAKYLKTETVNGGSVVLF